jgi:hypothetical protein
MPAVSKKQQKFFGMVRAAQKGEMKNPSKEILDVANDISMKDAKKFAKTKHKGLPEKKKMNEDNVLKKVAKQLDGASKMHKQQANKVKKHIRDMHREGMYDTDPKTGESPVATSVRKGNKKKGDDRLKHFAKLAKKMVGEENIDEKCWKGYEKKGMKTMFGKRYPNCVKKEEVENVREGDGDPCWDTHKQVGMKKKGGKMVPNCVPKNEEVKKDEYGDPVGGPKISKKQKVKNLSSNTPDEQHTTTTSEAKYEAGASTYGKATIRNKRKFGTSGEMPDIMTGKKITKDATRGELIAKRREEHKAKRGVKEEIVTESDKKGKGSGKKDACYHKVKSRYSVWPSAYASGALVKCRKKGAANWGNSSKKEEFSDWRSEFIWEDGDEEKN